MPVTETPAPQTPDRSVGTRRIGFINGLRGLSILAVVYHHLCSPRTAAGLGAFELGPITVLPYAPLANGFLGVNLFFILSGFVLYLPYGSGRRSLATREDFRRFYVHRFQRIMPLYYLFVVVMMITVAPPHASPDPWKHLVLMATATFPFRASWFFPREGADLWSLGVEIWFSVAFPFLLLACRRWGLRKVLVASLVMGFTARSVGVLPRFAATNFPPGPLKDGLLGRLDDFVLGMLLCEIHLDGPRIGRAGRATMILLGCLALLAACWLKDYVLIGRLPAAAIPFQNTLVQLAMLAIVPALSAGESGLARRLLSYRPLQLIGMMCYSIYLWHHVAIGAVWGGQASADGRLALYLVLVALTSVLSYCYIEFGGEKDPRRLFVPHAG